MQLAIVLSLAACFCTATASVCQRLGARNLDRTPAKAGGFDPWLVFRLARQPAWLLGLTCMIAGFVLQVGALRFGPLVLGAADPGNRAAVRLRLPGAAAGRAALGAAGARPRLARGRRHVRRDQRLPARGGAVGRPRPRAGRPVVAVRRHHAGTGGDCHRARRTDRRVAVAPRRLPRRRHRHHLGLRGRRDQGAQLARLRRPGRDLHQLVGLRADGHRRGRDAAGLARVRGRAAGRLPARLHHPRPGHRHPARRLPVQRAPGDLARGPDRRGDRPAAARGRRLRPQPQRPHHGRAAVPPPPASPDPGPRRAVRHWWWTPSAGRRRLRCTAPAGSRRTARARPPWR